MKREEVMLEMGINSEGVARGLGVSHSYVNDWVGYVQKTEAKYTDWWAVELKKREELEVAASVRAASRAIKARKLLREREEARQVVANAEMAAGSGGYAWLKKGATVAGSAAVGAAGAKAAQGLGEAAAAGKGLGGVFRELFVLIRELASGRYTNAVRSSTILFQRLAPSLARLSTAVPLLGLAVAAAWTAFESIRARRASTEYDQSLVREKNVTNRLAEHLRQDIANLEKSGRLSKVVADKYLAILAHPTIQRVTDIAKMLQPVGSISNKDASEITRLQAEHLKKLVEYEREGYSLEQRALNDQLRVTGLKHDMAGMDKNSLAYAQKQLELDEANHDLQEDQRRIFEGKLEMQRKINEQQHIYEESQLRVQEIHQHEMEKFMPTLQELAEHGGIGGRTARLIERDERRIKRDYFRGDVGAAGRDIAERNRLYDTLASRGLAPEREELREMRQLTKKIQMSLENIEKGAAFVTAKIRMG